MNTNGAGTPARHRWSFRYVLITWCIRADTTCLIVSAVAAADGIHRPRTVPAAVLEAAALAWSYYVRNRWCR